MRRLIHRFRRGQGLVEFALVLPIFLLVLFGTVDLGRYVFLNSTLSQAAREGARQGSVEASWVGATATQCGAPGGPVCPADLTALRADILASVNGMITSYPSVTDSNLHVSCDASAAPTGEWTSPPQTCAARAPGDLVSVRVVMDYQPITPIIGQIVGTIQSSGSATMRIN